MTSAQLVSLVLLAVWGGWLSAGPRVEGDPSGSSPVVEEASWQTRGIDHRSSSGPGGPADPEYGSYGWPVQGPVIRGFEAPDPYGVGHRGIDIGAPVGTDVVAPKEGVVAFAGWVGGALFVSVDHPDGVRTTYSWLSTVEVVKGELVPAGALLARTGRGHVDIPGPHLHFGARVGTTYIDPMLLLEGGSVVGLIHLAPIDGASSPVEPARDGWRGPCPCASDPDLQ